jgi:transcriptional regulator with XRE-family HTH domain
MRLFVNGKEVKLLLRIRRISQKEFSQRTGLTPVYVSRLLNQQSSVGLEAQKKIQGVLKFIPFERLFITCDTI